MQSTYVLLSWHGESASINAYQWRYVTPGNFAKNKMNEMFRGIEFIRAYINDMLIITKGDWHNHLNKLELLMKSLQQTGWILIPKSHSLKKQDGLSKFLGDTDRYLTGK